MKRNLYAESQHVQFAEGMDALNHSWRFPLLYKQSQGACRNLFVAFTLMFCSVASFASENLKIVRRWSLAGPTHHFALGVGHHAAELKKLGRALGIETVVVTEDR